MAVQITTNPGSNLASPYIDSLVWGNASWSTDEAVNVGFWTGASPVWGGDTSDAWSTSEIFAFEQVLNNYAAVSNLTFNTVTPSESTDISNTTDIIWYQGNNSEFDLDGALGWHNVPDGSLITQGFGYWIGGYFNTDESSWNNLTQGSYSYITILHELGHAMGLAHPHDGGGDGDLFPGVTSNSDTGDYALNQGIWTTMTYVDGWTVEPTSTDDYGWQMTLMAFDIAALQVIYGANNSYQTGDNTYTLSTSNGSGVGWECIWDAGGIDTISNAGSNQSSTINLNAAPLTGENAGGYVSWIGGITGGYTIANNVIIENAIGGDGDDVITGNDADNTIYDNAGTNTIDGGLGSDTLVINANYDNAISIVTSLTAANDQVTTAENTAAANIDVVFNDSYNQTISNSSTFTNTVSNVEYVQFNDQTVSLPTLNLGSLTITSVSADNGSVIVNGDNTLTYTPNTDYSGTDTVYYTVSDGSNSSSAEVNVTVDDGINITYIDTSSFTPLTDPNINYPLPSTTIQGNVNDSDGQWFTIDLSANDTAYFDIDLLIGDTLSDSVLTIYDSNFNQVAFNDDDSTDNGPYSLESLIILDVTQTDTYYVKVTGYGSNIGSYTLNVSLESSFTPTVTNPISNANTNEHTTYNYDISTHFNDANTNDVLTYSAILANGSALPSWLSINTTTGVLSGVPDNDDDGVIDITVTATDTAGLSISDTYTLTINNNVLNGTTADDTITIQSDTTSVQAGAGTDTVIFSGNYANYTFSQSDSFVPLMTNNTTNQVVSLYGVEQLQFDNSIVNLTTTYGGEFQVNTYTTLGQDNPSIATLNNGDFVITWFSEDQDGGYEGIYAQMYNADGSAQGGEFRVNTPTVYDQDTTSIAALNDGGFIIAWESFGQDGDENGIYAQRYDANGASVGTEFQVNTYTTLGQENPVITTLNNGDFVITWFSDGQDGSGYGVYAQRYDANSQLIGVEFQVNTYESDGQGVISIASTNDGGFIITWQSNNQDGSGYGVYAQRYDVNGSTIGIEFQVNSYTQDSQDHPSIAVLSDGDFVITWESYRQDGNENGVYAQRYDANGSTLGSEFQVNTIYTDFDQMRPSITALNNGGFVIAWHSDHQNDSYNIYAQLYAADGSMNGSEFLVNNYIQGNQDFSSITSLIDGGFMITWESWGQDGDANGIYAQRFDSEGNPLGVTILNELLFDGTGSDDTLTINPSNTNGNMSGGTGNDTLVLVHNFSDMTTGITTDANGDATVIITDASGNTTTITGVENFNFSDQSFTEATLQANDDVRPLFASPQLENGTWVNQYLLPDEFSAPGNPGLEALYDYQYFGDNDGNILVASDDNDFINGFGGDDAINTGAGNDIIDGGLGSNFLTGGTGNDTFFSDGREAGNGAITWSTVTDFTDGINSVNIWGYIDGTSTFEWYADAGATGWTGATLHADLDGNGVIDTSMTFTGMDIANMSTPQGLEVGGNGYLFIG